MGASNNLMSSIFTSRAPTVKGLQNILQQIGGATSGRKDALQGRILNAVKSPVTLAPTKETKILSIDMGIRNLAYCVANVASPSLLDEQRPATMDVLAWRRLDLTEEAWKHSSTITSLTSSVDEAEEANEDAQEAIEEDQDLFSPQNLSSTAFSLVRALLKHEPDIILIERQRWRSSGSSAIQQWTVRVNSLEAMLWAMFTAVRETPAAGQSNGKEDATGKFTVCSVDPKRVGNYWLDSMGMNTAPIPSPAKKTSKKRSSKNSASASETPETTDIDLESDSPSSTTSTTKAPPRAKAEKKAKINILRTWLDSPSPSTALLPTQQQQPEESADEQPLLSRPDIRFHFTRKSKNTQTTTAETNEVDEEDPVTARDTLLRTTQPPTPAAKKPKAKKGDNADGASAAATKKAPKGAKESKVDDITDCFLQAAAYVAWQMSLGELKGVVGRAGAEAVAGGGSGEEETKVAKPKKKKVARKVKDP